MKRRFLCLPCWLAACMISLTAWSHAEVSQVKDAEGKTYLVIDSDPDGIENDNYSEPGFFGGVDTAQIDSWDGNRRWGNDGESTSASWTFSDVPEGTYDVYASWKNGGQINVSTANYSGTDGFPNVELDQAVGAESFDGVILNDGARDINFASLGEVTLADGTFTLTVDDSVTELDPNTFIFADAIALGPLTFIDSDNDGMTDEFEDEFGLSKDDASDADLDGDEDDLTNLEEFRAGTDPTKADSDKDGSPDGAEVKTRMTDPNDDDSDDDNLKDGVETGTGIFVDEDDTGTDPNLPDTDSDGVNDGEEVANSTDPNSAEIRQVTDSEGNTYLVIDNGIDSDGNGTPDENSSGYSEGDPPLAGQDLANATDSWENERRWGNDGENSVATWSFTGLSSGTYSVYASWRNAPQGNVSTAKYSFSDDGESVELDQSIGAEGHPGIVLNDGLADINFAFLGEVGVSDGSLDVTVDDSITGPEDASTFIFADAVAIGPINALGGIGLTITEISYSPDGELLTMTWNSRPGETYSVVFSFDLIDWTGDLDDSIEAGEGDSTTEIFDLSTTGIAGGEKVYFRVQRN